MKFFKNNWWRKILVMIMISLSFLTLHMVRGAELDIAKKMFDRTSGANVYTGVYDRVKGASTGEQDGVEILRNLVVDVVLQYRWFVLSISVIFLMLAGVRMVVGGSEDVAKKQMLVIRDTAIGMVMLNISFFLVENIFGTVAKNSTGDLPSTLRLSVNEQQYKVIDETFAPVVIAQNVVYPMLDFFLSFLAAFTILYLVIAAFRVLTAQGSEDRLKNVVQIVINTVVGFAVIVFAKLFVSTVFGDVLQVTTTKTVAPDLVRGIGVIMNIVNYILGFFFFIAVVMYMYAGILYFWSGINEANKKKAQGILIYTTLGIFAALISYTFLYFVVKLA